MPEAGAGEMENCCWVATEFHFYKMKRASEMDGGDGCPVMWTYTQGNAGCHAGKWSLPWKPHSVKKWISHVNSDQKVTSAPAQGDTVRWCSCSRWTEECSGPRELGGGRGRYGKDYSPGGEYWKAEVEMPLTTTRGFLFIRKEYKIMNIKLDMTIPKALESLQRGTP